MRQSWASSSYVAAGLIVFVVLVRLVYLAQWPFGLYADESQYWLWAQHLDWGYYSKPPVVAWAIALTTGLCGNDSVFCVKLASPLAYGAAAWFIYLAVRRVCVAPVALWSAVLFLTIPGVSVSSMIISTDPFLLMFWAAAFWAFGHAVDSKRLGWWLMAGVFAGLGMMSKYNFLFFLLGVLLLDGWRTPRWQWLPTKAFWLACMVALLLFLPNLWWNHTHDWLSFQHTGDITRLEERSLFHPKELLEFIGAQVGLVGPVLFIGFLMLLWQWRRLEEKAVLRRLLAFVIPLLGVMLLLSFLTRAHGNWAAPVYVTLVPAVVVFWWQRAKRGWLVATLLFNLLTMGLLHHYEALTQAVGVELSKKTDPFYRVRGWRELGAHLSTLRQQYPEAGLLTDRRKVSAQLVYHTEPFSFDLVQWPYGPEVLDHYEQTTTMQGKEGQDFLFVAPSPAPKVALEHFDSFEKLPPLRVELYPGVTRELDVFYAKHYQTP